MKVKAERVEKDTFFKSRYVIFPLIDHAKWHWSLLVVDVTKRSIKHHNSLWPRNFHDSFGQAVGKFIVDHINVVYDIEFLSNEHKFKDCRKQDEAGVDCGVFVCMWAECFCEKRVVTFKVD